MKPVTRNQAAALDLAFLTIVLGEVSVLALGVWGGPGDTAGISSQLLHAGLVVALVVALVRDLDTLERRPSTGPRRPLRLLLGRLLLLGLLSIALQLIVL